MNEKRMEIANRFQNHESRSECCNSQSELDVRTMEGLVMETPELEESKRKAAKSQMQGHRREAVQFIFLSS